MTTRQLLALIFAVATITTQASANWITSWGDGDAEDEWRINQDFGTIVIKKGNGNDYKFYAETSEGSGVAGVINNITVDPNAVGDFTVLIDRSGSDPGAAQLKAGNLTHPVSARTATLGGVILSGDIGASGNVTIEELDGPFEAVNLKNTVTITSVPAGTDTIEVTNDIEGTLHFKSNVPRDIHVGNNIGSTTNSSALLQIDGDLWASIDVDETLYGKIDVQYDVDDVGDNHIHIRQMAANSVFECRNLALKNESSSEDWEWFVLGIEDGDLNPPDLQQAGRIEIKGTLSGSLFLRTKTSVQVYVKVLDAGRDPGASTYGNWHPYGGIRSFGGFTDDSYIEVAEFKRGVIHRMGHYVEDESVVGMRGTINILGDLGQDDPSEPNSVAGIWAWYNMEDQVPNVDTPPMDLAATITIAGDVYPCGDDPNYPGDPNFPAVQSIFATNDLTGRILVNGSLLDDGDPNDPEIDIRGDISSTAAISIDYDGWDPNDAWDSAASIDIDGVSYTENTPSLNLWDIQMCKGDMTNEDVLDPNDVTWLESVVDDPNYVDYIAEFPGLDGSIWWHANINCDLSDPNDPNTYILDDLDVAALEFFIGDPNEPQCCLNDCAEFADCRANLARDGDIGLDDLAVLLSAYGTTSSDPEYNPYADFDADGDVDLSDQATFLASYGESCSCFGGEERTASGGGGESTGAAAMSWLSRNTFSTTAGDYIFDLNAQLTDSGDAWTSSGVALTAHNGAEFRLAWSPTTRNAAATFVCSPGALTAESPASVEIAGSHSPADAIEVFETDEINIVWFDRNASTTGSGAVMRLVIDAGGVTDGESALDVSGVYVSQTGPARPGDILIVNVASETGTLLGGASTAALNGAFYATE